MVQYQLWINGWNEGIFLFNDTLNTFNLRLYGVGHMVKDHSDSEREKPLPPHGLFSTIDLIKATIILFYLATFAINPHLLSSSMIKSVSMSSNIHTKQ